MERGFCFWAKTKASKRKINKGKKAAVHQSRAKFSPALRKKEKRGGKEKEERRKKETKEKRKRKRKRKRRRE